MLTALEKVGVVCITIVGLQVSRFFLRLVYNYVIAPRRHPIDFADMGKWACVTGATDGIGRAYAEKLAEKGLNIFLISRSKAKLEQVASEIGTKYNVETKVIEADFSSPEVYGKIEKQLWGNQIGVLVNNVGTSYNYPEYFLDVVKTDEQIFDRLIQCNVASVTHMCRIVMPFMVERGKGVVINLSSLAADMPSPLLTVYAATKAYVEKFSRDLAAEYKQSGIIVQNIKPGFVATKMAKIRNSTWMAPSPAVFVDSAIRTVGYRTSTTGYYPHTLMLGTVRFMEAISPNLAVWVAMKQLRNIRERAITRTER